jgi:hypothetical protein
MTISFAGSVTNLVISRYSSQLSMADNPVFQPLKRHLKVRTGDPHDSDTLLLRNRKGSKPFQKSTIDASLESEILNTIDVSPL